MRVYFLTKYKVLPFVKYLLTRYGDDTPLSQLAGRAAARWIFDPPGCSPVDFTPASSMYYLQPGEILSAGLKPGDFLPLARSSPVNFYLQPGEQPGEILSVVLKPGEFLLTGRAGGFYPG